MPAEWAPHERTLMAWPCRKELWGSTIEEARRDHATVINAIAAFEPVTLVVHPSDAADATAAVTDRVEVVQRPIDDSWMRDTGPIYVVDESGLRTGVHFRFNGWGGSFTPFDGDEEAGRWLVEHLGDPIVEVPLVLEGGSIAVDGEGTLVTTEQCLLHPTRNPRLGREEIEARLREALGVEQVVWLGLGLLEDDDTDGHVDNICAWIEPGRVLLQTVADENDPNFGLCRENAERLSAAGIDVVELDVLPRLAGEEPPVVVPYVNFYIANGALIVPVTGAETDGDALALLERLYPGREAVPVSGTTLALGGGGVHCITQQVPAR